MFKLLSFYKKIQLIVVGSAEFQTKSDCKSLRRTHQKEVTDHSSRSYKPNFARVRTRVIRNVQYRKYSNNFNLRINHLSLVTGSDVIKRQAMHSQYGEDAAVLDLNSVMHNISVGLLYWTK